jgi:hypothetical protein
MKLKIVTALALMAGLSSCTFWEDTHSFANWYNEGEYQELIIRTDPPLADCTLIRDGVPIAHLTPTPGAVFIPKTKYAITITCSKAGFETASVTNDSDTNGATVLRVVLFGLIQWPIESINGSDNKYDSPFTVSLPKQETPE